MRQVNLRDQIRQSSGFLLILTNLIIMTGTVSGLGIGTAPADPLVIEADKGDTVEKTVLLRIPSLSEGQEVGLEVRKSLVSPNDYYEDPNSTGALSEQENTEWVEITNATILGPNRINVTGTDENFEGLVRFKIDVPSDADRGTHLGRLKISPSQPTDSDAAAGLGIFSGVLYDYKLKIGEGRRDLDIQQISAYRQGPNEVTVGMTVVNRGTVTASPAAAGVEIRDRFGNRKTLSIMGSPIQPGEAEEYTVRWENETGIPEGEYDVTGSLDDFTGKSTASDSFSLPDINRVEVRPADDDSEEESSSDSKGVPVWLVAMVLVILAALMYALEVDPLYIAVITGGIAGAAFILMTGVSNLFLVALIILVGVIIYR